MLVLLKTVFPESIISLSRAKSVVMVSPLKSFYWKVWTESSKFLSVWWTWASHVIVCSAWHQAHTINVTTVLGYEKTRLKFAFYCEKFLSYNLKFVGQFEVIVNLSSSWKWTNPRKKRNCCCWWFDKKTTFSVKLFWDIRYFTGKLI